MYVPCSITTATATRKEAVLSSGAPAAGWAGPRKAARLALRSATGNQTPELTAGLLPWAAVAADNHSLGVQQ
jgi:hypothetical protein